MELKVKEKSRQVLSICGNSFKTVGKAIPGDDLMKLVKILLIVSKAVIKVKGGYFEETKV